VVAAAEDLRMKEALREDGREWWLMPESAPNDILAGVQRGSWRQSATTAEPVLNSQSPEQMLELGGEADYARRQVPVEAKPALAASVNGFMRAVAAGVGDEMGVPYDAVTPHLLIALPRAPAQLPHADYVDEDGDEDEGEEDKEEMEEEEGEEGVSADAVFTVYFAFQVGTAIELWSDTFAGDEIATVVDVLPPPMRVEIPVGRCLVVRSTLIQRGTANPHARRQLRCVHSYLAGHLEGGGHKDYAQSMALSC